eukprot:13521160-Alexandrium_andersonii.AAC.1
MHYRGLDRGLEAQGSCPPSQILVCRLRALMHARPHGGTPTSTTQAQTHMCMRERVHMHSREDRTPTAGTR